MRPCGARLPHSARKTPPALLLMVVQGFTAQEAAAIIGASATAMGKRIGRAKSRLLSAYLAQNASNPGGRS